MLADGVEAAARANRDHSAENIAAVITNMVEERIREGQLDDCALTLLDLSRISATFGAVLQGIYHPRVLYPAPTPLPTTGTARRVGDGGAA
jgi:membrane-associated HD superfamily phosphohydrolase